MDSAISLKTGQHVTATSLAKSIAYRASLKYLLVCPECGEPFHFKLKERPYNTPFFSHYKELETIKVMHGCSLRVWGATFRPASSFIAGIKHGQAVDLFQKDFCKEIYKSFGKDAVALYSFIEKNNLQKMTGKNYIEFIRAVENKSNFKNITRF